MAEAAMVRDPGEDGGASATTPLVLFLVRPRPQAMRLAWLVGALAVATLVTALRLEMGLSSSGVPLVFYLPAIMVVTLVAGWEYGTASLIASVALVWFIFVPPAYTFGPMSRSQAVTLALWAVVSVLMVALAHFLRGSLISSLRNEARYRRLASLISDIVWMTDGDGNVREPNAAWSRVTGMQWPDYGGRRWANAVHEDDRGQLMPTDGARTHMADFRLRDAESGDWRWYQSRAVALRGPGGDIAEWITALRDIHESKLAKERDELMIGEARHRLKNLVTIIDALAKYSKQRNAPPNAELDAFLKRFLGRLHALGAAADLVLAGQHQHVEIGAVIRATLAPFLEEKAQRFRIDGPDVTLSEATGGSLALAIHELATNALKYGALTAPDGYVTIGWKGTDMPEGEHVCIEWEEHGGPAPHQPEREGFGGRVIKSVPAREKNGLVTLEYRPEGLYCRMEFVKNTKKD
jgi:PAS domain S-box-containing protein